MRPGPGDIPATLGTDGVQIGGFGTRFLAGAEHTGGAYALIEHTLEPRLFGAPPHRHAREDELSYVQSGTLMVWRAGSLTAAGPGAVVAKPRGDWHTCWNAGPEPVRFLELISPPAFASYFRDLGAVFPAAGRIRGGSPRSPSAADSSWTWPRWVRSSSGIASGSADAAGQ